MKKLIIVAVVVIAIVIGAPLYTGKRTHNEIEKFALSLEKLIPETSVSVVDYDKGLFSATGKLVLVNTEKRSWQDNPIVEIIKRSGADGLAFDINASHGLLIFSPSFKLGLGHATFSLDNKDNKILSRMEKATGLDTILTNDLFINISGHATNNLSIPKFSAEEGKISFGGVNVDVAIDPERRFELSGTVGASEMNERRKKLSSEAISFSAKGQLGNKEWPIPTGTFEMKTNSVDLGREGAVKNLSFKGSISEDNSLLSSIIVLAADSVSSPDGQTFSDIRYDVALSNINKAAITEMTRGNEDAMIRFLQASPTVVVKKIAADAGDMGKLDISGGLSFDGQQLATLSNISDINTIVNAMSLSVKSEFNLNVQREATVEESTIRFDMKDKTFDMRVALGAINVPRENITISPILLESKGEWKDSMWVATEKSKMSVESVKFADKALIKQFESSSVTTSNNDLMKSVVNLSLGQLTSQKPAIDLANSNLDLIINNISESGITGIYNLSNDPENMMKFFQGDETLMTEIESLVKKMIDADPSIVAKDLSFNLAQDTFKGKGSIKLDQTKITGAGSVIQNPSILQLALMADAKATFSQSLPLTITEMQIDNGSHYGVSKEDLALMKQSQKDSISAMLQQVVEQGFLKIDGDNYTVDAQYRDGQLMLNGQPAPF